MLERGGWGVPARLGVGGVAQVTGGGGGLRAAVCRLLAEGVRLLEDGGYRAVVVSDQSGVARGRCAEGDLRPVENRLCELLIEQGVALAGRCFCPHLALGVVPRYAVTCACRQPAPGPLLRAAADLDSYIEGRARRLCREAPVPIAVGARDLAVGTGRLTPIAEVL